ncbi:hypothetical protein chiPu_0019325, partial [Chiloscyllium punctatum]|nr:hypothetical protein [Chiloscyllium punctatum]
FDLSPFHADSSLSPFAGIDISSVTDELSANHPNESSKRNQPFNDVPVEGALSSDLDKIVTEELAQMESKDVQQLFTDVLGSQGNPPLSESTLGGIRTASESHLLTSHGLGELIRPSVCQRGLLPGGTMAVGQLTIGGSLAQTSGATGESFPNQKAKDNRAAQRINKAQKQVDMQGNRQPKIERPDVKQDRKPPRHLQTLTQNTAVSSLTSATLVGGNSSSPAELRIEGLRQNSSLYGNKSFTTSANEFVKLQSASPSSTDSNSDLFPKLHMQSPTGIVAQDPFGHSLTPYPQEPNVQSSSNPSQAPAWNSSHHQSGVPRPVVPGRPQIVGPSELHSTTAGTSHHQLPLTPDSYLRSRVLSESHDSHTVDQPLGSPGFRSSQATDCYAKPTETLTLPSSTGEQLRRLSDSEVGAQHTRNEQYTGVMRQDLSANSLALYRAAMLDPSMNVRSLSDGRDRDIFKAPLTPRSSYMDQTPIVPTPRSQELHPQSQGVSPQTQTDLYRQSPSTPFSDPYHQPPLTPRPSSSESCSPLPPKSLTSDSLSRVPMSPQSQCSSPLTPRPHSNETFSQSPIASRFQSPDPYSRPPSRDPYAQLHKPQRPQMVDTGFKSSPVPHGQPPGTIPHSAMFSQHTDSLKTAYVMQPQSPRPHSFDACSKTFTSAQPQSPFPFTTSPGDLVKETHSQQSISQMPRANNFPQSHLMGSQLNTNDAHCPQLNASNQSGLPDSASITRDETFTNMPLRPSLIKQDTLPLQQDCSYQTSSSRSVTDSSPSERSSESSTPVHPPASPSRDLHELPFNRGAQAGNLSQTELEKQRQRQRLRQLLIRQQIQRNNLRQEKEQAAACGGGTTTTSWSQESSSQPHELQTRAPPPYPLSQDRSGLRGLIPGSGNGRLINPVVIDKQRLFPQDENLCRPPQPSSTPTGEVNTSRQSGVGNPQGFHPRSLPAAQQQQWQQQLAQRLPGQTRFQQPEALHVSRPAMTMQMNNTTGLNPRLATQITFQNAQQQIVASPIPVSPQYIELRHNSQRLPIAAQLTPRTPQPRQRLPLPNQEINQYVHQMQGCKVMSRGPGAPLSQSPVGIALLPQQNISAQLPPSPQSVEVSNAQQHIQTKEPLESTAQVQSQQVFQTTSSTSSSPSCCSDSLKDSSVSFPLNSVPSMSSVVTEHADLDPRKIPCDDSVEKALDEELDSPKELDEEDDLANLSLDPDSKTDDELGNLDNLETNDPHLDDLLKCEEFDLLAYTDPELDTGDKKDIFTEQLRLVESANEKAEEGQDILAHQDTVNPAIKGTLNKVNKSDLEKTAKGDEREKTLPKSDVVADTLSTSDRVMCGSVNNVTSETSSSNQCSDPVNRAPSSDDPPKPTLDLVLKVEENISKNSTCQFVANTSDTQTVLIKSESQSKGNGEKGAASVLLSIGTGLSVNVSVAQCHSTECTTSGTQTTAQSGTVASSGHGTTHISSNGHSNLDLESKPCTSSAQIVSKIPLAAQSRPTMDKLGLDEMCHHVSSMEPKRRSVDDLVKVESSLEASELPLLLHDLLEQEKMELQQQQLGGSQCIPPQQQQQHSTPKALQVLQQLEVSHQQSHSGLSQHLSTTQQSQHLEGPSQNLNLPQQHILGVIQHHHLGIPRSLPSSQQQQLTASQQRLGTSPHVVMSQQQQHVATGQHPPQQLVATQQNQHMTSPQLLSTQQLAVSQLGIMQQTQQVVMQQQQQLANAFFPDTDLDKFAADDIMDPIAKAKMVALKGIKKVMAQGNITVAPGMNRQQVSLLAQRLAGAPGTNETQTKLTTGNSQQEANSDQMQARPNPPTFVQGFINEAEHRQYEEWLLHTQQLLQMQLKFLEEQIGVHRKSRKALCAKQRTAKKAGREFPEADAEKLKRVTEQQSKIQKQLDQVRKQQKEHTNLMTEYRNKQQQKCSLSPSGMMPTTSSQNPRVMPKLSTPMLSAALAQQGGAILGSPAIAQQPSTLIGHTGNLRVPQIGATVPLQQGPAFLTSAVSQQPEYPPSSGTVSSAPSTSYFSGNSAAQTLTNESRLLQERQLQLQQRMQLIQQQGLVGPSQQQSIMGKLQQQGIIGQLQPTTQQSIVGNKPSQQGIMGQQQQAFIGQQQGIVVQSQHQPAQQQQVLAGQQLPQQHNNIGQTQQQSATQHQQSLAPQQQHLRLLSQQQGLLVHQQSHQQGLASHPKPQRPQQGLMAQQLTHQQGLAVQQQVLTSQQQQQNLVLQQQTSNAPLQQQGLIGHQQGAVSQNQQLGTIPLQQHHLQAVSGQLHPQSVIRPNNILRLSTSFQQQSTMGHQARMQGIMRQQSPDVLGQHLATQSIMGQQTPLQVIRHQLPGMIGQGMRQQHPPQVSVEQGQQPPGTMGQGQQHQPQSTIGQGQENQPHAVLGIGQQPQPSLQPQGTMGMEQQQQPLQTQGRIGQQSQPLSQPQGMVEQGVGQQNSMGQQPPQGPLGQGMPQQQSSQGTVGMGQQQQSPQITVGLGQQQTQPQVTMGMGKQQPHHQAAMVVGQQHAQPQGGVGMGQQQAQPQGSVGMGQQQAHPQGVVRMGQQQAQPQGAVGMGQQQAQPQASVGMVQQHAQPQPSVGMGQQQTQPQISVGMGQQQAQPLSSSMGQQQAQPQASGIGQQQAQPQGAVGMGQQQAQPQGGAGMGQQQAQPQGGLDMGQQQAQPQGGMGLGQQQAQPPGGMGLGQQQAQPQGGMGMGQQQAQPQGTVGMGQQQAQPQGAVGMGQQQAQPQGAVGMGQQQAQPQGGVGMGQQQAQPQGGVGMGQQQAQPQGGVGMGQQQPQPQGAVEMGQQQAQPPSTVGMEQQQMQLQAAVGMGRQQPQPRGTLGMGQHQAQPLGTLGMEQVQTQLQGTVGMGQQQAQSQGTVGMEQVQAQPLGTVGMGQQQAQSQGTLGMGQQQAHHQGTLGLGQQQAQPLSTVGLGQQQAHYQGAVGLEQQQAQSQVTLGMGHQQQSSQNTVGLGQPPGTLGVGQQQHLSQDALGMGQQQPQLQGTVGMEQQQTQPQGTIGMGQQQVQSQGTVGMGQQQTQPPGTVGMGQQQAQPQGAIGMGQQQQSSQGIVGQQRQPPGMTGIVQQQPQPQGTMGMGHPQLRGTVGIGQQSQPEGQMGPVKQQPRGLIGMRQGQQQQLLQGLMGQWQLQPQAGIRQGQPQSLIGQGQLPQSLIGQEQGQQQPCPQNILVQGQGQQQLQNLIGQRQSPSTMGQGQRMQSLVTVGGQQSLQASGMMGQEKEQEQQTTSTVRQGQQQGKIVMEQEPLLPSQCIMGQDRNQPSTQNMVRQQQLSKNAAGLVHTQGMIYQNLQTRAVTSVQQPTQQGVAGQPRLVSQHGQLMRRVQQQTVAGLQQNNGLSLQGLVRVTTSQQHGTLGDPRHGVQNIVTSQSFQQQHAGLRSVHITGQQIGLGHFRPGMVYVQQVKAEHGGKPQEMAHLLQSKRARQNVGSGSELVSGQAHSNHSQMSRPELNQTNLGDVPPQGETLETVIQLQPELLKDNESEESSVCVTDPVAIMPQKVPDSNSATSAVKPHGIIGKASSGTEVQTSINVEIHEQSDLKTTCTFDFPISPQSHAAKEECAGLRSESSLLNQTNGQEEYVQKVTGKQDNCSKLQECVAKNTNTGGKGHTVKQESIDAVRCGFPEGTVKRESNTDCISALNAGDHSFLAPRSEAGQLLLQKLLRTKNLQLVAQRSGDGTHLTVKSHIESKAVMIDRKLQGATTNSEIKEFQEISKKNLGPKTKRTQKSTDRGTNSRKKNKKDEGIKTTDALMKQLQQQLSLLPLVEPTIEVNFGLFPPFGSSPFNSKNQLKGSFGNAVLDNAPDYYSQLLYKQNNLSNPPTPPSSLPPTPPPSVQQKLVNGLASSEELTEGQKELEGQKDLLTTELKNMDMLASLPTPPHNQNEELSRAEIEEDRHTPDSIDINRMMTTFAQLLQMKIPSSYEVTSVSDSPHSFLPDGKKPILDAPDQVGSKEEPMDLEKLVLEKHNWFKQYDVSLPGSTVKASGKELATVTPEVSSDCPIKERIVVHHYSNNMSVLDVHQLPILQPESSPLSSPSVSSPGTPAESNKPDPPVESPKIKHSLPLDEKQFEEPPPQMKRWRGIRWKRLEFKVLFHKGKFKHVFQHEIEELIQKLGTSLKPDPLPKDTRRCCFCHEEGDGMTDGPARLLNLDLDLWVHLNCALWSSEVYETQAGALINVEVAFHRGLTTKCAFCQKTGATTGCHRVRCPNTYHFACAIRARCMFFKDKTMLCSQHKLKGANEQEIRCFAVYRRVYIQRDEVKQIASIVQRGKRSHMFRVGGLIFHTIGQLLPHQMQEFHSVTALYPIGYEATRIYWSMRYTNKRCCYHCTINDTNGKPEFGIQVIEQGHEDLIVTDWTPQGVWNRILEPIVQLRKEAEMLRLFPDYIKGEDMFGLTIHAVLRIAESLPGVESCQNYIFRYGRHPLMELPLAVNPTGCARSEPKIMTHYKRPHTLNSTSTSKAFQSTVTGEINTPYSKQFVHSKSSQYRRLKTEWKNNVYLARSRIQGLGLYAAKDLEKHTMVIEYIGTIIRNEVANRREKLYETQNRGVYMFRINNEHVIDATLTGGPARYINHSCAPNCVAEVVTFDKEDKIIIISSRRIPKGEELTYDYKFDFEDDQHKIPCHCGALNCRKWMN